jgi:hypothetical protein
MNLTEPRKLLPQQCTRNSINETTFSFVPYPNATFALTSLLIGATSQGLAYVLVWSDDTVRDMIASHCGLFCMLWTVWTVGLNVFVGLNLARCGQTPPETGNAANPQQQRTMLRMEAMFFAGSILGIWSAWVGIDALRNDTEHTVSMLILLCLSIASFATILHCCPEESCVEDPGCYAPPQLLLAAQTV